MNKLATLIYLFLGAFALLSCAAAPDVTNMIPSPPPTTVHTDKVLRVGEVTGGQTTNPLMQSMIDDAGFRQALIETLQKSGLFSSVVTGDSTADYELRAEIVSQEVQGMYDATATLFVNYRLLELPSNQEIWKENLLSRYMAEFEESFVGVERRRKANEGAVRENLNQLVERLSQVLSQ